jgi:hypothetical protein
MISAFCPKLRFDRRRRLTVIIIKTMHSRKRESSALLGRAIAMSAGLYSRLDGTFIAGQFEALQSNVGLIHSAKRRILRGAQLEVREPNSAQRFISNPPPKNVIISGSEYSATALTIYALSSIGMKLAGLYWAINRTNRESFERSNMLLIDMNAQESTTALFKTLQHLHESHYMLFILCDAPGRSRRLYRFLGYDVNCSSLIGVLGIPVA